MSVAAEPEARVLSRRAAREPKKSVLVILAWGWLGVVLFVAVFASVLAPQGSDAQNVLAMLQGPSAAHSSWNRFARTQRAREEHVTARGRPSRGPQYFVAITLLIGATSGVAAGYLGGAWDRCLSTVSDVAQSIPGLLIGLVVFAVFPDDVPRGYGRIRSVHVCADVPSRACRVADRAQRAVHRRRQGRRAIAQCDSATARSSHREFRVIPGYKHR